MSVFEPAAIGPHAGQTLAAYVLGALGPRETEAIRGHLQQCSACAAEHDALVGLHRLLDLALKRPA